MLPDKGDHEASTFPQLAQEGKLLAFKSEAFWRAVDTVKDLTVVKDHLSRQLLAAFLERGPRLRSVVPGARGRWPNRSSRRQRPPRRRRP